MGENINYRGVVSVRQTFLPMVFIILKSQKSKIEIRSYHLTVISNSLFFSKKPKKAVFCISIFEKCKFKITEQYLKFRFLDF